MTPTVSIRHALNDPKLLGTALAGESWKPWRTLLIAAMGEQLTDSERELFKALTGRDREPGERVHQLAAVVGRRGGKSKAMATLASYIGGLCKHDALVPGEKGVLLCVALDQRVAAIILNYCEATFANSPVLKQLIVNRTQDALELSNGVSIEVRPASFRKLRGPTFCGVIADELAFWYSDSAYANPDIEVLNAIEPGLATTNGMLILASSPHARRGVLRDTYRQHYGAEGDPHILVAHGASRVFNTTLSERVVARALEKDESRGRAEYLAEFRTDIETYIPRENVEACIDLGVRERGPISRYRYSAFCDPASGSGPDSFTMAIGHRQDGVAVIDAIREVRPQFSPEQTVSDLCVLLDRYSIKRLEGDRWGGEFVQEPFKQRGITYSAAAKPKSAIYVDFLALLNSKQVSLLDHPKLISQIVGLERRVGRGSGREVVDHGPHGHDDVCNAVAGVCVKLLGAGSHGYDSSLRWVSDDVPAPVPVADDAKSLTELLANLPAPSIRNGPDFFGR